MKKFYRLKYLLCFILSVYFVFSQKVSAQVFEGAEALKLLRGSEIVKVNPLTGDIQYALLSELSGIKDDQADAYLMKVYGLSSEYSLKQIRDEKDEIGFRHLRFQQYFKDFPISGGILIAHIKNGLLHSFNGEIFRIEGQETNAILSEGVCLRIALDTLKAVKYKWELPEEEVFIKEVKNDADATWFPKGELVYCPENMDYNSLQFHLAYKFNIYANEPLIGECIYIDATNGKIIARENLIHTGNVTGSAATKYSGTQSLNTDSTAPGNYRLRETVRGNGVTTMNMKTGTSYGASVDFTDADNYWNNVNAAKDEVATDCHWGAEKTYDFYKQRFNRNSYDNNNARINSFVHYSTNYDNAFWNGVCMTYGDGNSFKPLTSLDVCGHEVTHAVTSYTAGLIYSYESGALNESFSDIFGNAIERYAKPSNYSWKIGEEITYSGNGLRNMLNPKLMGHPRCYKSTNWYYGAGDNGGVHINSGVQNWWFYLVTEGGSGTNDASSAYSVDSLGILKAEQIAYRNLTVYLTPTSQYADARFYSIRAATDLYGACSKEVIAVTNAWHACNVGPKYDSGYIKAAFIADTIVCNVSKTVKFTNMSANAVSSKWYFGDGATSTTFNPTYTYSNYGSYNVKLVATSCFKNKKDSITKNAYVKIDSTFDICNAVLMPLSGSDSTHKCQSFVYDDGGEDIYRQQRITHYRISAPGADSIRIKFFDFDYEFGYDSLYVYRGKYPGGTKLGGFTGSTLPFAGKNFTVAGNMITLRHVSDPLVVGRGFKMHYTAFKKPVAVKAYSDTSICYGNSTLLYAKGTGGYSRDYFFRWKNVANNDSVIVSPASVTTYKVTLMDVCTKSVDSAQVTVSVRDPLKIEVNKDTTICAGQNIFLSAVASGGKSSAYQYTWNNGLSNNATPLVTPMVTTVYRVILSDGCTPKSDTAFVTITVKSPLSVKINTPDSVICFNKSASLTATGNGGDGNYLYTWDNGLGTGDSKTITLSNSTWVKVTLTDGCTVIPGKDSVFIIVNPKLQVNLNEDTIICRGSGVSLIASVSGGVPVNYTYTWSDGLPGNQINAVTPAQKTKYFVTLKDNCSDEATDSISVDLMAPLQITGMADTTICAGNNVQLKTVSGGGKASSYQYTWNNGLGNSPGHWVTPTMTTQYRVILSDACTVMNDTAIITVTVEKALSVKLNSPDTIICYNKSADLSAVAGGGNGNYVYTWDNGLGTGANKSITLLADRWVKVTLTDACTVIPATDSILIKVRSPLTVSLNNDSTICKGSFMNLVASPSGGDNNNYVYQWTQGLPGNAVNNVSPAVTTKYVLTLKDNCSDDAKDSIVVNVLQGLKITGIKDTTICYGGSANYIASGTGGVSSQYSYEWSHGLGTGQNKMVSPLVNTTYKIRLKDNCTVPYDSLNVNVFVRAPLKLSKVLSNTSMCIGDSVKLTLNFSGGIPIQYEWYINGIRNFSTGLYLKPNVKTHYKIELLDNCSVSDTSGFDIDVDPLPVVGFSADRILICRNDVVQFGNLSSQAVSYEWKFNATDKSSDISPSHKYISAGKFDVSLTATSAAGCKATASIPGFIEVVELPKSSFVYSPQNATYLNPDITFTNQSKNYTSFAWDFGDFSTDSVSVDPVHRYGDTGHYKVVLTTMNSLGCTDVSEKMVLIKDVYSMYIPDAISVNNDGINDELMIVCRGVEYYNYSIYNRWGAEVFSADQNAKPFNGFNKDGQMMIKGTYLLTMTVKSFDGKVYNIKQMLEIL